MRWSSALDIGRLNGERTHAIVASQALEHCKVHQGRHHTPDRCIRSMRAESVNADEKRVSMNVVVL
jgi:hypothetical protein